MNYKNEKIAVLYGSQTGNAQEMAERIWRDSKRFYFRTAIKPLDDYDVLELINEQCVIFVCSTTGQGEEPDNMKSFWRFMLKKNLSATVFSNLRFVLSFIYTNYLDVYENELKPFKVPLITYVLLFCHSIYPYILLKIFIS